MLRSPVSLFMLTVEMMIRYGDSLQRRLADKRQGVLQFHV